jgi:ADP-heptose:LPS heptosyltransferase
MTNTGLSKLSFGLLDRITDKFPSFAPHVFQRIFLNTLGSDLIYTLMLNRYKRQIMKIKNADKILVVVDVNIGDSIIMQQSVRVLRFYFPNAVIDYACSKTGAELLSGIEGADNVFDIFTGKGVPSMSDDEILSKHVEKYKYSLVLNLSPFIKTNKLPESSKLIKLYLLFGIYIVRLWRINDNYMHISAALHNFLHHLLNPFFYKKYSNYFAGLNHEQVPLFEGNSVYVKHKDVEEAKRFLFSNSIFPDEKLLFCNPDSTSVYTQVDIKTQANIIKDTLESGEINHVLLGAGFSYKGIEKNIIALIPPRLRKKVIIVPHMAISIYTALIDFCDVFFSGDSGPMHIAASRKEFVSPLYNARNKTAVISLFGATDSRTYGYDSHLKSHIPANQNAPSKVFFSNAPCRNITCINKWGKSCKVIRCHTGRNPKEISHFIISYFHSIGHVYSKEAV